MMSAGFAAGKPAADLSARDLMWLNEHPKEAKAALELYAKAENERGAILTAANNDRAVAKKALEDAQAAAKDKLIAADAEAMKIINEAKANAEGMTLDAQRAHKVASDKGLQAMADAQAAERILSEARQHAAALDKREVAVAKAEARVAAKESDLQRRIAIVDAAHAEARTPV